MRECVQKAWRDWGGRGFPCQRDKTVGDHRTQGFASSLTVGQDTLRHRRIPKALTSISTRGFVHDGTLAYILSRTSALDALHQLPILYDYFGSTTFPHGCQCGFVAASLPLCSRIRWSPVHSLPAPMVGHTGVSAGGVGVCPGGCMAIYMVS